MKWGALEVIGKRPRGVGICGVITGLQINAFVRSFVRDPCYMDVSKSPLCFLTSTLPLLVLLHLRTGDPAYVSYGPCSLASWHEASNEA